MPPKSPSSSSTEGGSSPTEGGRSHTLAAAILISSLVLSATAIWVTLRLTSATEAPAGHLSGAASAPRRPSPGAASTATPSPPATVVEAERQPPRLTQEEFSEAWQGSLRQRADEECFAPHEARGEETESSPFFSVTVAPDGSVESVSFSEGAEERFGTLFPCVAKFVEQVQLPSGPRRSGSVQAARPPRD